MKTYAIYLMALFGSLLLGSVSEARQLKIDLGWTSGSKRTDLDLSVKHPDGRVVNYAHRISDWGATFIRDDRGAANTPSSEQYAVDLDQMDCATSGSGVYEFYIDHYSGPGIGSTFTVTSEYGNQAKYTYNTAKGNHVRVGQYQGDASKCKAGILVGVPYFSIHADNGLCLTEGSTGNLMTWKCEDVSSQKLTFGTKVLSSTNFKLLLGVARDKALKVRASGGRSVVSAGSVASGSWWRWSKPTGGQIEQVSSSGAPTGKCMDIEKESKSAGAAIILYDCKAASVVWYDIRSWSSWNQRFSLGVYAPAGSSAIQGSRLAAGVLGQPLAGTIGGTDTTGAKVVAMGGANVIAMGGANVVAMGGANVVAMGGMNLISDKGLGVVAMGGANVIAMGGMN